MQSKDDRTLVWSGPTRPPVRGSDGILSHSLYVWAYDDGTVQVSTDRLSEACDLTEDELVGALAAAVRGLADAVADAEGAALDGRRDNRNGPPAVAEDGEGGAG